MSIELVMPSNHLILCCPLLLLPSIFPSIRVFSNELALCIRWPKYWSFSFSISPSNEYSVLISCLKLLCFIESDKLLFVRLITIFKEASICMCVCVCRTKPYILQLHWLTMPTVRPVLFQTYSNTAKCTS